MKALQITLADNSVDVMQVYQASGNPTTGLRRHLSEVSAESPDLTDDEVLSHALERLAATVVPPGGSFAIVDTENLPPDLPTPETLINHCKSVCADRLAAGFAYDFGDVRGVHVIGTTEADLKGWDEVEKIFAVAVRVADTGKTVTIATDTGIAVVDLDDWNAIMLSAEAFRQPIWAASFAVQAKVAAGVITTIEGVGTATDWP